MSDLLQIEGWEMYYECDCAGGRKQYYKKAEHPNYEIVININRSTFAILLRNHVVFGPDWIYKMEQKLKEHELIK